MYREYLAEFWYSAKVLENSKVSFSVPISGIYGKVGVNTFRNSIGAHYLPHSREYVAPLSIDIVRLWFETIRYGETVSAKGTLKKSLLPPRWRLLMEQIIQFLGGKTGGFDQITNKDAIILYSLANGINIDYASIFWEDIINKLNTRHTEKVVPYARFLSLLMMYKMNEGYEDGEVTPYPTQVFSVNNWALKTNQPEEPPFTDHMLAICTTTKPMIFKAPKPSFNAERVPQGTTLGAKPGHKKHSTSSKQPPVSRSEATKASAPVVAKMHKEDQQAIGGPTSLGVTSEERDNPQLSSGNDASTVFTAEADPRKFAPSDFLRTVKFKAGSKSCSSSSQDSYITTRLELLFHLIYHAEDNSMSMLVKDIRSQDGKDDKDNDKGSKSRSQSMKEQDYNEDKDQEHSSLNDKSNLTDLMKESKRQQKVGSSKAPTSSKTSHSKKRKESSSAMDSNPSQPPVSTPVDTRMHKEDQQVTGGLTSLGVTGEARANPQLSSGMPAFNLNEPIYLASFIIHSESASRNDASAVSIAEADPGKYAPSNFVPQQQGMNEGTKNTSYDQLFAGTDPHVLADKTQSVSEGLETVLTQPTTGKGANSFARQVEEDETSRTIKLEDLAKLVSSVQPSFKDLDSPENDPIIVVDDSDKELTNQVLILQSQNHKLELEKNKAKAEAALLKAQPSFSNELPAEFVSLLVQVASVQAKQKTLDVLPGLLLNVTKALDKFAQVLDSASSKAGDQSVPSAGQADTMPVEGEKNKNQATISQIFQKRAEKNVENENPDSQQLKPIPPIITTTAQMQSLLQSLPKSPSQPEEERIKKDKGKKAMSSEESNIIK
ncbi:hypothetical protein Tco_0643266 [Tanacetum coccineum]